MRETFDFIIIKGEKRGVLNKFLNNYPEPRILKLIIMSDIMLIIIFTL